MTRLRAVVFDMDDTLYPERQFVLSGYRAVAFWAHSRLGIPVKQVSAELNGLYEAGVRGDTFSRWLTSRGWDSESLVNDMVRVYREHTPVLNAFPEVPDILSRLHERFRLGLVSDGYIDVQRRKWRALSLARHFDAVVFSDLWGRGAWKPNMRPFIAVSKKLSVPPGATIYVADNPLKDFLGARRAGMQSIRVKFEDGEYASIDPPTPEHAPDHVICGLGELERSLHNLSGQ